jgi:hypothetical protein
MEREEVVEERKGVRECEQRGPHEHEWCHGRKASIERAKYQSELDPHRGKCEVGSKLEEHTVRGRTRRVCEVCHKHGELRRGDNETAEYMRRG